MKKLNNSTDKQPQKKPKPSVSVMDLLLMWIILSLGKTAHGVNWERVHYLCVHVWPCRNLCIWTQHTWQSRNPPTMWLLDVEAPKRTRPWEIIRKDINVTNLHDQHGHDVFEPPDVNLLCHVWGNVFNIQVKFRPIFLHRCTELPAWYHSSSNIPLMWQTTVWIPDRPPSLSPLPQNISLRLAPFFPLFALSVFLTSWHTQRALSNRQTLWNTDTEKKSVQRLRKRGEKMNGRNMREV